MRGRKVRPMIGDAFAEFERAGWERAAPRYEEYWTDTVLFVEPLLDAAGVRAGSRLLDVACGPGFVSEAAEARVAQPERALAEVHRVLVPHGRLAFTTWLAQGNAEDEITEAALAAHAVAVEGPEGPSYHVFADRDECRRALAGCGFDTASLRMETVTALWRVPSADFLFQAQLNAGVRTAAVLRAQPPEQLEAIRAVMANAVRGYADGEEFALPIAARLISARASGAAGDGQADRERE